MTFYHNIVNSPLNSSNDPLPQPFTTTLNTWRILWIA